MYKISSINIYFSFFLLELKSVFSYRVLFWLKFALLTVVEIVIAALMWQAIYSFTAKSEISGYSLEGMIFYYVLVSLIKGVSTSDNSLPISAEIYSGTLTKYLLYPVNYLFIVYAKHLASFVISVLRFIIGLSIFIYFWDIPLSMSFDVMRLVYFFGICFLVASLHFLIVISIQLLAFWYDVVWNLKVMLDVVIGFLSGKLLPLSLFGSFTGIVNLLPFKLLYWFPVRFLTTNMQVHEIVDNFILLFIWIVIFCYINYKLWHTGKYNYIGAGI